MTRRPRLVPAALPDPTVLAIPAFVGSMVAEYRWLRRRADAATTPPRPPRPPRPSRVTLPVSVPAPRGYERRDTVASLTMGLASLLAPLVVPALLRPLTPGRRRLGNAVVGTALGAAAATTAADAIARRSRRGARLAEAGLSSSHAALHQAGPLDEDRPAGDRPAGDRPGGDPSTAVGGCASVATDVVAPADGGWAGRVAAVGGVTTVVAGALAVATFWHSRTNPERLYRRRLVKGPARGPAALALAVLGWDFLYYWNHRLMHECRYLWALHVVHHSSERYNLSTALRQPVADSLGVMVPYGALCLAGIEPQAVATARAVNLLYQYWIHTETIGRLGAAETTFNTPSHHRVHHGSNRRYLDRNHGGILIVWDRLFGTFEPEAEPVVYGLTKNVGTFAPGVLATHEYRDILHDVARSTNWGDRLSFVLRGPGWAGRRRIELGWDAERSPAGRAVAGSMAAAPAAAARGAEVRAAAAGGAGVRAAAAGGMAGVRVSG